MRFLRWLFLNKYKHIEHHLEKMLDGMEGPLVGRVRRRAETAVRLQMVRVVLFAIIILPAYATLITGILEAVGVLTGFEQLVRLLASVAVALAGLAAIGLFLVQRSLGILEADIYMFSMILVQDRTRRGMPGISEDIGRDESDSLIEGQDDATRTGKGPGHHHRRTSDRPVPLKQKRTTIKSTKKQG